MDVIELKVLSGCLFFFLALGFGWLPFCLHRRLSPPKPLKGYRKPRFDSQETSESVMQCLHSLASGVLIATCLLHLMPESLEAVENGLKAHSGANHLNHAGNFVGSDNESSLFIQLRESKDDENEFESEFYPLAEFLMALGFMFVYMFDSTFKAFKSKSRTTFEYKQLRKIESVPEDTSDSSSDSERDRLFPLTQHKEGVSVEQSHRDWSFHSKNCNTLSLRETELEMHASDSETCKMPLSPPKDDPSHSDDVRSLALVMALCIHGFFDGVMLGLQSSVSVILSLLFALSLHKSFVSLSLSLTLVKNYSTHQASSSSSRGGAGNVRLRCFLYVLSFASVAPVGLIATAALLHRGLSSPDGQASVIPGCLQAFAVGTFLYVTFTETTGRHGTRQTVRSECKGHIFLSLGFALMASLRAIFGNT